MRFPREVQISSSICTDLLLHDAVGVLYSVVDPVRCVPEVLAEFSLIVASFFHITEQVSSMSHKILSVRVLLM